MFVKPWMIGPVFAPEGDGPGADGGEAGGEGDGPAATPPAITRPESIPEKFWPQELGADAETAVVPVEALSKMGTSYTELEGRVRQSREEIEAELREAIAGEVPEGVPESPDGYEIPAITSEDLEIPEGLTFKVDDKDPMLQFWRETCHKAKLGQDAFKQGIVAFAQRELTMTTNRNDEIAKLGENGKQRVDRVDAWLAKNLPENHYNAFIGSVVTGEAIEALEALIEKASGGKVLPPGDEAPDTAPQLTLEELRQMQADPRYRDPQKRDPAFIAKVEEGFKKLYPGKLRQK